MCRRGVHRKSKFYHTLRRNIQIIASQWFAPDMNTEDFVLSSKFTSEDAAEFMSYRQLLWDGIILNCQKTIFIKSTEEFRILMLKWDRELARALSMSHKQIYIDSDIESVFRYILAGCGQKHPQPVSLTEDFRPSLDVMHFVVYGVCTPAGDPLPTYFTKPLRQIAQFINENKADFKINDSNFRGNDGVFVANSESTWLVNASVLMSHSRMLQSLQGYLLNIPFISELNAMLTNCLKEPVSLTLLDFDLLGGDMQGLINDGHVHMDNPGFHLSLVDACKY